MADRHLRVFKDRSELVHENGEEEIFLEGPQSLEARERYRMLVAAFSEGFLDRQIERCKSEEASELGFSQLSDRNISLLDILVNSITADNGRALVALTIMQLCIKSIAPEQSIRLHKGGKNTRDFSWRDGISMRSLGANYVVPSLRKNDLLLLNSFGMMMTRELAENYPYSSVYKAQLRGARREWHQIIDAIEAREMPPAPALRYLISQLVNQAQEFELLSDEMISVLNKVVAEADEQSIFQIITNHINQSDYAARLMEVAMHSLMQTLKELGVFSEDNLVPLSQMRSANKKHGNLADIEVIRDEEIVEAWDAKFGKSYLRDEIEELYDKLANHNAVEIVGFVTSGKPERLSELAGRIAEIEDSFEVKLQIIPLDEWVQKQFARAVSEGLATSLEVAKLWLIAYGETLAQKRREIAPIDEPCYRWVMALRDILSIQNGTTG